MVEAKTFRGVITGPRLGMKSVRKHQYLARFEGVSSREEAARLLLGRKAVCMIGSRKKILGRIVSTHGENGTVIIRFRKGLPEPSNGLQTILKVTR
ncbi:MAG: 50S ribosomal protein L35ae [Thermoproteota archaeon]